MQIDINMKAKLLADKFVSEINKLGNGELNAEAMYRQMANIAQEKGLFGMQIFFLKQAKEEGEHYQQVVDFLNDYGVCFDYACSPVKISEEINIAELFLLAMNAEKTLYNAYAALCDMGNGEEYGVFEFALKKVKEQRKSVGEWGDIIARYELNGDIYALDDYLKTL